MSGRRRKGGGAAATHTHLAIKVEGHEVSTEASLHIDLDRNFGRPFGYEDDPAYTFSTRVRISGVCTYPPQRATDSYELTFVGQEPPVGALPRTVGSFQVQDDEGRPKWRRHQGKQYPVYEGFPRFPGDHSALAPAGDPDLGCMAQRAASVCDRYSPAAPQRTPTLREPARAQARSRPLAPECRVTDDRPGGRVRARSIGEGQRSSAMTLSDYEKRGVEL